METIHFRRANNVTLVPQLEQFCVQLHCNHITHEAIINYDSLHITEKGLRTWVVQAPMHCCKFWKRAPRGRAIAKRAVGGWVVCCKNLGKIFPHDMGGTSRAVRTLCKKSDVLFNPEYTSHIWKLTVAVDQGVSNLHLF